MTADNSHAESRILDRALTHYDYLRRQCWNESIARQSATLYLHENARLDYITAAERLADALARRAANKLENANG